MRNRIVAIIDDDKVFLNEIEEILLMGGYDPVVGADVFMAQDAVIRNKPDVILMEFGVPRKNGFELYDAIYRVSETRGVPIIAMSEFQQEEFNPILDTYNIKRWLKKPFQPLDVIWAIEREINDEVEAGNQWSREGCLAGVEVMV